MLKDKNHCNNNSDKKAWRIRDVFIAIIVWIVILIFAHRILGFLSFVHPYFINHVADLIGTLVAVYILNQKYPLQLSLKLNLKHIFQYVLPAVLLYFFILFVGFPYFIHFGHLENLPKEYNLFIELNLIEKFFFCFFLFLLGPIIEEIFFRGFIYRIIRNRYNILCGTVISTGIFYASHGLTYFHIIIISLIFTYVYQKTGNIWNSIIVHSLNNTLWLVFVYWGAKLKIGN